MLGSRRDEKSSDTAASSSSSALPLRVYHHCLSRFLYHSVKLMQTLIKLTKATKPSNPTDPQSKSKNAAAEALTNTIAKALRLLLSFHPPFIAPSAALTTSALPSSSSSSSSSSPSSSLPPWVYTLKYLKGILRLTRLSFFSGSSHELNTELFLAVRREGGGERLLNLLRWAIRHRIRVGQLLLDRAHTPKLPVDEKDRDDALLDEDELLASELDDLLNELAMMADSLSRYESLPEAPAGGAAPSASPAAIAGRQVWHPAFRAGVSTTAASNASSSPSLSASSMNSPSNAAVLGGADIAAASVANLDSSSANISDSLSAEAGLSPPAAAGAPSAQAEPPSAVWYTIANTAGDSGPTIIQVRASASPQLQGLDSLLGLPPIHRPRRPSPRLSPLPHYSPHTTVSSVAEEQMEGFDLSTPFDQRGGAGSPPPSTDDDGGAVRDVGTEKFSQLMAREVWRSLHPGGPLILSSSLHLLPVSFSTLMLNVTHRWLAKARRDELKVDLLQRSEQRRRVKEAASVATQADLSSRMAALMAADRQLPVDQRKLHRLFPTYQVLRAMEVTGSDDPSTLSQWLNSTEGKQNVLLWRLREAESERAKDDEGKAGEAEAPATAKAAVFGSADLLDEVLAPALRSLVLLPPSVLGSVNPQLMPPLQTTKMNPISALLTSLANLFVFFQVVQGQPERPREATDGETEGPSRLAAQESIRVSAEKVKAVLSGAAAAGTGATGKDEGLNSVWLSEMREKVATVAISAFRDAVHRTAALPVPQTPDEASALERSIHSCHALLLVHLTIVSTDRKSTLILPHELVEVLHLSALSVKTADERLQAFRPASAPGTAASAYHGCNGACESYMATLLFAINYLLDSQTSDAVSEEEIAPLLHLRTPLHTPDAFDLHPWSLAPSAAAKIELLSKQPYRSVQAQQRLLDICLELLPSAVVQDRAICALVQILARLTRSRPFVERFLVKGGMRRLMNVSSAEHWRAETEKKAKEERERKRAAERAAQQGGDDSPAADDSKKADPGPTAPAASNLLFESSLATLLAHLLTPPSALQGAMQEEIVTQLTDYAQQVAEQRRSSTGAGGPPRRSLYEKGLTIHQFVFLFSTMCRRDAAVFIRAVREVCVMEKVVLEMSDADKKEGEGAEQSKDEEMGESKQDSGKEEKSAIESLSISASPPPSSSPSPQSFPQSHLCIRLKPSLAAGQRRAEAKEAESKLQPSGESQEDASAGSNAESWPPPPFTIEGARAAIASYQSPSHPSHLSTPALSLSRSNSNPSPPSSSSAARRRRSRSRSRSAARDTAKAKAAEKATASTPGLPTSAGGGSSVGGATSSVDAKEAEWAEMDGLVRRSFHLFLDGVVLDLQRCLLRLQRTQAERSGSDPHLAAVPVSTRSEATEASASPASSSVETESAFVTPARSSRGKRRERAAAMTAVAARTQEPKSADAQRRQVKSARSNRSRAAPHSGVSLLPPVTPLSIDFHPLLDHATCRRTSQHCHAAVRTSARPLTCPAVLTLLC